MKKLKLNLGENPKVMLSREQMKKIIGGYGDCQATKCGSSPCTDGQGYCSSCCVA